MFVVLFSDARCTVEPEVVNNVGLGSQAGIRWVQCRVPAAAFCIAACLGCSGAFGQQVSGPRGTEVYEWLISVREEARKPLRFDGFGLEYDLVKPPPTLQQIEAATQRYRESQSKDHKQQLEIMQKQAQAGTHRIRMRLFLDGDDRWRFSQDQPSGWFRDVIYTPENSWSATNGQLVLYGKNGQEPAGSYAGNAAWNESSFIGQVPGLLFGAMGMFSSLDIAEVDGRADAFTAKLTNDPAEAKRIVVAVRGDRLGPGGAWQFGSAAIEQHDVVPQLVGRAVKFAPLVRTEGCSQLIYGSFHSLSAGVEFEFGLEFVRCSALPPGGFAAVIARPDLSVQIPLRGQLSGVVRVFDVDNPNVQYVENGKVVRTEAVHNAASGHAIQALRIVGWATLAGAILTFILIRQRSGRVA